MCSSPETYAEEGEAGKRNVPANLIPQEAASAEPPNAPPRLAAGPAQE